MGHLPTVPTPSISPARKQIHGTLRSGPDHGTLGISVCDRRKLSRRRLAAGIRVGLGGFGTKLRSDDSDQLSDLMHRFESVSGSPPGPIQIRRFGYSGAICLRSDPYLIREGRRAVAKWKPPGPTCLQLQGPVVSTRRLLLCSENWKPDRNGQAAGSRDHIPAISSPGIDSSVRLNGILLIHSLPHRLKHTADRRATPSSAASPTSDSSVRRSFFTDAPSPSAVTASSLLSLSHHLNR